MSDFAVDLAGLAALVQRMQRCTAHLDDVRRRSEHTATRLHVSWTGDAAAAHRAAAQTWDAAMADAQDVLAQLHSAALMSHGNYIAALDANRSMWSGG